MIDREEIRELAREFQLEPNVVEKDYVLGWLLAGLSAHPDLAESWIFKGGTCLKKCFFETYRFSEDLDFTLRDPEHLNAEFLSRTIAEVTDWVYDASGLELPDTARKFEVFTNPRGKPAAQARVGYRGPLGRVSEVPRIKLDLAADEALVLPPVRRPIHHPFSDDPEEGLAALCYAFEEVFAEKVRALTERMRPRDLYDVVHLHRRHDLQPNRALVRSPLASKCEFKGIEVLTFAALAARPERAELESEWANMLAHQLPMLPPFAQFWDELPQVFAWIAEEETVPALAAVGLGADVDTSWRAPAMATAWGYSAPLEAVRFAGANRLCVQLLYSQTRRLVEPYSLRRTKDENLVLYAYERDSEQIKAFRVDRIEGIAVTSTPFVPRYAVELSGAGPISAPAAGPRAGGSRTPAVPPSRSPGRASKGLAASGPTYMFQCSLCGKRFNRKSYDATLNPHKNKSGWDCAGRAGLYMGTR